MQNPEKIPGLIPELIINNKINNFVLRHSFLRSKTKASKHRFDSFVCCFVIERSWFRVSKAYNKCHSTDLPNPLSSKLFLGFSLSANKVC